MSRNVCNSWQNTIIHADIYIYIYILSQVERYCEFKFHRRHSHFVWPMKTSSSIIMGLLHQASYGSKRPNKIMLLANMWSMMWGTLLSFSVSKCNWQLPQYVCGWCDCNPHLTIITPPHPERWVAPNPPQGAKRCCRALPMAVQHQQDQCFG